MISEMSKNGIELENVYFCPHKSKDNCECRKPKTGLIQKAMKDFDGMIDLNESFFIGDKTCDIKCGENAGIKTILVKTGEGGKDQKFNVKPDFIAKNLKFAADKIFKSTFY